MYIYIYPASRPRHAQASVAVDCLDLRVGLLVGSAQNERDTLRKAALLLPPLVRRCDARARLKGTTAGVTPSRKMSIVSILGTSPISDVELRVAKHPKEILRKAVLLTRLYI